MNVTFVGSGPAVEAARAALGDVDVSAGAGDADAVERADFAVVSGLAGAPVFERANEAALDGDTPWLAVEVGGVGGHAIDEVDAAVSGHAPSTGCHDCLRARVAATLDDSSDEPRAERSAVRLAGAVAGREAVALLSGGESVALGGVVELPWTERSFLPVPHCPACGAAPDRTLELDHESAALEDSLARAESALDERVGVVASVGEVESFPAPYYLATVADTSGFSDAVAARNAAGVDAGWDAAFMKALGEALERYAAGVYRRSSFERAPAAALDDAVPPDAFVRPPDAPTPAADEPLEWVEGLDLATGGSASIPAEFVQFPPPNERLKPAITTGLGLGNSTVEAVLSGLYEVLERDATMLAWYSTFDPLGLSVDDDAFATLAKRARAEGLSVTPLLVTQDVDVPVVAVAVHRDDEWPRFAVGSGASLSPDAAARSALAEALQNWMELRSMGRETASDDEERLARHAEFSDAARSFVDVDGQVPTTSVGPDPTPSGRAELDAVVERVTDAGLTPYVVRSTPRDVERIGFEAVRALVPSAQPLFTTDPYFGERARTVPDELGFAARPDRERHPYP